MACSCGTNKCGGDCGCDSGFSSEGIERAEFQAATYPGYKEASGGRNCTSNKGKFFDLTLEDFIVPDVGREAYIKVCDGSLWKAKQYIGVFYGANFAAFKITEVGKGKLKVLNGCDKSGDNPFIGNPDKGTNIPEKSILCAIPPTGCSNDLSLRIIEVLTTKGAPAILDVLANSEEICFTSALPIGEDEETHLFGGTTPDCDCAPDAGVSSCLRKLIKLFTRDGGRTLCSPESPIVNEAPVNGVAKRMAIFDENGCIHRGPTISDFKSCSEYSEITESGYVDAIIACKDGVSSVVDASSKNLILATVEIDDPDSDDPDDKIVVWKAVKKDYALIQHTTGAGVDGGATVLGDWKIRPLTQIVLQTSGFVSLASNIFTINKPGVYSVEWVGVIFGASGAQTRIEDADNSANVFYGNSGYTTNDTTACGQAIIEVTETTNKRWKMMYRVATSNATDGLGRSNAWGPNVYCSIIIKPIL